MRVPTLLFACVITVGVLTPLTVTAQAPNYSQDFSANFPIIDPETNGYVTVVLTNEDGDSIVPFADFAVPLMPAYTGRHQFGARTGGANANQEVSGVTSTYSLGGVDTVISYDVDPFPEIGGNNNYEPQEGFDEGLILLSEDGVNSVQSAVAWDQQYDGDYDTVQHVFAFRISGFADPANDQADGIGWSYLDSEQHDTVGAVGPGVSEEPNYSGSLGVGFDIWDNGNEGGNSISVHYNGRVLDSIAIDEGTTDPNTGDDWTFNSFETDEMITASIIVTPGQGGGITQPELIGGSPYSAWNKSGAAPSLVQVGGEASTEGYLRIAEESGSVANVVAFDYDGSEATADTVATFNFRGLTSPGSNRADGMAFLLVPTELYDDTGADLIDFGPHEEPNLAGALGVGFDTFNNDGADQDAPEGNPNVGNHISIHYDGEKLAQFDLDIDDFDLVTEDADVWHTAEVFVSGDQLTVVLTNGDDDSTVVVFDEAIDGLDQLGVVRPAFAARTGGAFDNYEVDNFTYNDGSVTKPGDYNGNGLLDADDLDMHASIGIANQDLEYDVNEDGQVNTADRVIWVNDLKNTWMGDADLNGQFDSGDLVTVFAAAKYETGQQATWGQGDWNGDLEFSSGDLVTAFSNAGYEGGERPGGPNPATAVVPEPSSIVLLLIGSLLMLRIRRS